MHIDLTDYDALADKAERGQLHTRRQLHPGTAGPLDLTEIFMPQGRPRGEENTARCTWKIRAPQELDNAVRNQARNENMPKSALIRKAVTAYLETQHAV